MGLRIYQYLATTPPQCSEPQWLFTDTEKQIFVQPSTIALDCPPQLREGVTGPCSIRGYALTHDIPNILRVY